MKKKTLIAVVLTGTLAAGGLLSLNAYADGKGFCDREGRQQHMGFDGGHHGDRGHMGGPMGGFALHKMERIAERLELSDAQRDTIFAAIDTARPTLRDAMRGMRDGRQTLMELDPASADYQSRSAELAASAGQNLSKMVSTLADVKAKVFAELNDEQRAELETLMAQRRGGKHHM